MCSGVRTSAPLELGPNGAIQICLLLLLLLLRLLLSVGDFVYLAHSQLQAVALLTVCTSQWHSTTVSYHVAAFWCKRNDSVNPDSRHRRKNKHRLYDVESVEFYAVIFWARCIWWWSNSDCAILSHYVGNPYPWLSWWQSTRPQVNSLELVEV